MAFDLKSLAMGGMAGNSVQNIMGGLHHGGAGMGFLGGMGASKIAGMYPGIAGDMAGNTGAMMGEGMQHPMMGGAMGMLLMRYLQRRRAMGKMGQDRVPYQRMAIPSQMMG